MSDSGMVEKSKPTPELYERAAQFYDWYPTGQYDDEAAHALRCHFDLLSALRWLLESTESVMVIKREDGSEIVHPAAVAARAAIAKAEGA